MQKADGTFLTATDYDETFYSYQTVGQATGPYPLSISFSNELTFEAKDSSEIVGIYEYQLFVAAYSDLAEPTNIVFFPDNLIVEVTEPPLTFD